MGVGIVVTTARSTVALLRCGFNSGHTSIVTSAGVVSLVIRVAIASLTRRAARAHAEVDVLRKPRGKESKHDMRRGHCWLLPPLWALAAASPLDLIQISNFFE